MFLDILANKNLLSAVPELPMGHYAHLIVLRETTSFPLFQTDGELNVSYVSAGLSEEHHQSRARIVLFKRKQTSAERLHGRELLRLYNIISSNSPVESSGQNPPARPYACEYNSANFCKVCPDCIFYGFAIGAAGSERSKVLSDSAFSLTPFDVSHQIMTFNGTYENGTMSKGGETRNNINEQNHVLPQVFFPAVITIRDPTEAEFLYVLNNVLNTTRYGAQTTRTGTIANHLIAAVFAKGEIFSNLKFTQALYDAVGYGEGDQSATLAAPLPLSKVKSAASQVINSLLEGDGVPYDILDGEALRTSINTLTRDEDRLSALLQQAADESFAYATTYGVYRPKRKGRS